jgi:SAM-dependent methyltransferase
VTTPAPTGERLDDASALYSADLARHRAAYRFATGFVDGLRETAPLLDIGCGTGYGTAELSAARPRVVGLDQVAPAPRARGGAARFVRGDLEALPFPSRAFAAVTSFQVVEHLADPHRYLAEIARVLEPDVVLLISTPNICSPIARTPITCTSTSRESSRPHWRSTSSTSRCAACGPSGPLCATTRSA